MGNRNCCGRRGPRLLDGPESNPALQAIREAQLKYFNSHIEYSRDDSFDEDDDRDDSVDIYGSESSLDLLDDGSNDGSVQDATLDTTDTATLPRKKSTDSLMANGKEPITCTTNNANTTLSTMTSSTITPVPQNGGLDTVSHKKKVVRRKHKSKFIRLSKRANFFSIYNHEDKKARAVDPRMYQYPFENLIFEGGGNKGLAYCGAVRLLEELDIWPQIKRLAGTSAGAMTAALLAVGYSSHDLEAFFSLNLNKIFLDHRFGYLSLLPNLLSSYGWNPGKKIYTWFGQKLYDKMGDMDVTFREVYEQCGRELCVVVTNLNQMTSMYCHPKTTPDMPVRLAVRMSMSIPGMFQAVKYTIHGSTDVFVDGGVLCNYPIHCFDGWWLSMKPNDNFLEKLQPLEDIPRLLERSERFGIYNEKTLGMQLYSDNEQDLLKYQLENLRHGVQLQELPNTKLAREKIKKKKLQLKTDREHRRLVKAMNAFLKTLRKHNTDRDENIDRDELEATLNDEESFPRKRRLILFGDVSSDVILDYLDRDHNGQISYDELVHFMEETGISMQNRFLGYQRRIIKNFPMFLDTLQTTLLTNVKRVYVEERDLKRTVGINTGHVGTSDFVLEPADIEFVLERGRRSLEAFLKYYVASHNLRKRPEFRRLNDSTRADSKASLGSVIDPPASEANDGLRYAASPLNQSHPLSESSANNSKEEGTIFVKTENPDESVAPRTKSCSSGKSVSICERIYVIEDKDSSLLPDDEDESFVSGDVENDDTTQLMVQKDSEKQRSGLAIKGNNFNLSLPQRETKVLIHPEQDDIDLPTTPLLCENGEEGDFLGSDGKVK